MPGEENKALVRRVLAEVRHGWTPAVIEQFFAPDYRRHLTPTGPQLTGEKQGERASRLREAFPDADATLEDIVAEGDRVRIASPSAASIGAPSWASRRPAGA